MLLNCYFLPHQILNRTLHGSHPNNLNHKLFFPHSFTNRFAMDFDCLLLFTIVCVSPDLSAYLFLQASPAALAKCVLAEVPKQVVEYFSHKAIPPINPVLHSAPNSIANTPE